MRKATTAIILIITLILTLHMLATWGDMARSPALFEQYVGVSP